MIKLIDRQMIRGYFKAYFVCLASLLSLTNLRRCPGANERGLSDSQLTQGGTVDCDPNERPIGP